MFGTAVGILSIVWSVVGAVLSLFIGAVILLVISSICKGSTDFESNLRVTAAVMVVMPISAFLSFTGGINLYFWYCGQSGSNRFCLLAFVQRTC